LKREKIKIDGMSCGHCVMAVKKELSKLPVNIKDVSIGSADLEYDETLLANEDIAKAINNAGYSVKEIIKD
jgi:copper chaperone CopZ